MRKILILIVTLCIIFMLTAILPVHGESEIYGSVLRLHVLANSDSDEDQALKLKVRDAILYVCEPVFSECSSQEEAIAAVQSNLSALKNAATEVIRAEGYDYNVSLEIGKESYPTRNYEAFCFPAGTYASLRIIIGEGEGQNWWCVLFPPLCMSAATAQNTEDAFISVGLTKDQYGIITETQKPTYSARFRILEVIEEALD